MKKMIFDNNITVKIENLTIGYDKKHYNTRTHSGGKVVASNINASIIGGELTCLLGANGVGKSTLLKTLSAFIPKLDGRILLLDKDLDVYRDSELSKVIGVVLTDKCDIKNMYVRDLVGLGRSPYTGFWGVLDKEDQFIVDEAIKLINIENLAHRMVHTLSDGERQKVMIAKALAQQTPIIFLDEPTAFLDFPSKVEIMQLLHKLTRQTGKTIFLSTHDLELALQIADKIWLMDKTHGFAIGSPEDMALNGMLSGFFARKGITFDNETGLFRVENSYTERLNLQGIHGNIHAMVRKALLRNGILAGRNEVSDIVLTIEANTPMPYVVKYPDNKELKFSTIEELCIWAGQFRNKD